MGATRRVRFEARENMVAVLVVRCGFVFCEINDEEAMQQQAATQSERILFTFFQKVLVIG